MDYDRYEELKHQLKYMEAKAKTYLETNPMRHDEFMAIAQTIKDEINRISHKLSE